jgi:hypothetical protein
MHRVGFKVSVSRFKVVGCGLWVVCLVFRVVG